NGRQPWKPPHVTAWTPCAASAEPASPPTRAWPELDGSPRSHVRTFHTTAASTPAPITEIACAPETETTPAIVLATAVPTSRAPRRLNAAESSTASSGRAPRVATRVAIAFAASWKPFVTEKAKANETASQRPIAVRSAGPGGAGVSRAELAVHGRRLP